MNTYSPPGLLFNAHLETIYPSLLRTVNTPPYTRERINTPDDDFLDLDWLKQNSTKLVILSHGLEGNSSRTYIRGMAKAFFDRGFDVLAWNYRGCSEEMNRQVRFYHSGATDDLDVVVRHAMKSYQEISLIGFSLGGNLTLKYLGERGTGVSPVIKKAIVFSVPMDLHTSCLKISHPGNWIYARRFLASLRKKIKQKAQHRKEIGIQGIDRINTLLEFDDRYTAPIHGFSNALHYYRESSSLGFVQAITLPCVIVNALNDPFLTPECSPAGLLRDHAYVTLETPSHGGHVGFSLFNKNGLYWSELRALEFLAS